MRGFFSNLIKNFNQEVTNKNQNNNNIQNKNTPSEKQESNINKKEEEKTGEIVIVNDNPIINKKEGYYYKKYINDILKLKPSEPIFVQRQKMNVNFDKNLIGNLYNNLNNILEIKSNLIDLNQKELFEKIMKTNELANQLNSLTEITDEKEINNKEKKLMEQIDYLESYINSLSLETDKLLIEITQIEEESKK